MGAISVQPTRRRNVLSGAIGNVLEWYDFAVYGTMAPVLGKLFFPADDPVASLLAAFGVFAVGYAVRPLGGVLLGHVGDRIGRKPLIVGGMLVQAAAIAWIGSDTGFLSWSLGAAMLGLGTAMVYPTLLAAIGDVAAPTWRARAVGVYRLWRDLGFAVGALAAGVLADALSIEAAIYAVAGLTALSGVVVLVRMAETRPLVL